jgi:hypothetical protein
MLELTVICHFQSIVYRIWAMDVYYRFYITSCNITILEYFENVYQGVIIMWLDRNNLDTCDGSTFGPRGNDRMEVWMYSVSVFIASAKEVSMLIWSNVVCAKWRLESITRGLLCMTWVWNGDGFCNNSEEMPRGLVVWMVIVDWLGELCLMGAGRHNAHFSSYHSCDA